jgi:hypothetical protein
MTDTAARVVGPMLLTNASVTLYTVPASTKAILRHIRIANTSGAAATARLSIGVDAAGTRILGDVSIPAASVYDWSGFLVMEAAETLRGQSGTTNVLAITVSGVLVT